MKIGIGEVMRMIQDPSNLPALVLQTMPGIGQALARMGAAQQVSFFASQLAAFSGNVIIGAAANRRDLTPEENAILLAHTRATLRAVQVLLRIHEAPALDVAHLAEGFGHGGKSDDRRKTA